MVSVLGFIFLDVAEMGASKIIGMGSIFRGSCHVFPGRCSWALYGKEICANIQPGRSGLPPPLPEPSPRDEQALIPDSYWVCHWKLVSHFFPIGFFRCHHLILQAETLRPSCPPAIQLQIDFRANSKTPGTLSTFKVSWRRWYWN